MSFPGWKSLTMLLLCAVVRFSADETARSPRDGSLPRPARDENTALPDHPRMERLMQQKMTSAQQAFAAIARGNYEQTTAAAARLIELSREEVWQQMASPRYVQDTADFVRAVELLERMATAQDSDGTVLAFTNVAVSCSNCHTHARAARVAKAWTRPSDSKQLTASRL
jgi:hypothetical protein